jgi:hypothetical protein
MKFLLKKKTIHNGLLLISFFLMSCWDLYTLKYGRFYDLIGVSLFFFFLVYSNPVKFLTTNEIFTISIILVSFFLLPAEDFYLNFKRHLLIFTGFLIFIVTRRLNVNDIKKLLYYLIIILIVSQIIEVIYFYFFSNFLFFGDDFIFPKRNFNNELNFFRPIGPFFLEANAYASTLATLYASQLKNNSQLMSNKISFKFITLIVFCSLLISNSIFGLGMALLILTLYLLFCPKSFVFKIFLIFFLIFYFFSIPDIQISRLLNFSSDPSAASRLNLEVNNVFDFYSVIIPKGFNSLNEKELFGSNGFTFIFDGLGIFGIVFYLFFFFKFGFLFTIFFLCLNLTYPVYLIFIFYVVIGVLMPRPFLKN